MTFLNNESNSLYCPDFDFTIDTVDVSTNPYSWLTIAYNVASNYNKNTGLTITYDESIEVKEGGYALTRSLRYRTHNFNLLVCEFHIPDDIFVIEGSDSELIFHIPQTAAEIATITLNSFYWKPDAMPSDMSCPDFSATVTLDRSQNLEAFD